MVSDDEMYDSLSRTAANRKRLDELILRYVRVASLRLGLETPEIADLLSVSRASARSLVMKARDSATEADRRPPRDRDAGTARVREELPALAASRQQAEELVQRLARVCVLRRGMSANELARRTGHSRDFTQKWVKQMKAEPPVQTIIAEEVPASGWRTPVWEEDTPVDPKYIITAEQARTGAREPVLTDVGAPDHDWF